MIDSLRWALLPAGTFPTSRSVGSPGRRAPRSSPVSGFWSDILPTRSLSSQTDIIKSFKHSLEDLEWMDSKSAKAAAEKVRATFEKNCVSCHLTIDLQADALRVKVGFPLSPDTRNARSIAFYYYLVKIDEHDFFGNMLSARFALFTPVQHRIANADFGTDHRASDEYKKWQKLGKRRDPEAWEMYPSQVNAYFNPPANEVVDEVSAVHDICC